MPIPLFMLMTCDPAHRPVALWLFAMAALVAVMVTVGGATRLTDSGLSITEWDLVMGTLPPLSDAAWETAFEKYKQIPEYAEVNFGMTMAQFREIFWWEWGHRFLGRVIGLVFLGPLLWWSVRGRVTGGLRWRLWGLFALIGLQGAIGWFMVVSGLQGRVDVSQYRLALHLGTAVVLFLLIVWQALSLVRPSGWAAAGPGLSALSKGLLAATYAQVILGAFVAGLRAGHTYNTWPLMDGRFVPDGYFGGQGLAAVFESIAAVQFNHRTFAYAVLALAILFGVRAWRAGAGPRPYAAAVLAACLVQVVLGIWALVAAVPLWLGLAHQAGALLLLTTILVAVYALNCPAADRYRAPRSVPHQGQFPTAPDLAARQ